MPGGGGIFSGSSHGITYDGGRLVKCWTVLSNSGPLIRSGISLSVALYFRGRIGFETDLACIDPSKRSSNVDLPLVITSQPTVICSPLLKL